ncbi:hypothetical protein PHYSODRAFT_336886 [Phytophthora sojae]|uniref:Uncharacterized protein n=1 Tax=Phytophthora sojae (strain P6497) TaxID=1094619 RepID=G4ZWT6_PHYSP|nr:hypothetical protein PHYSODRAFT_336886 [Phytophthora sojae]EGZ12460.1 hypothetical protein PHYSODRAFT_336886 [Phytophthora sojae]|eukprot:XP_009532793.1 hypothetical protein PHYSODRAFT_336886 [Phytophthora sojae]
MEQAPWKAFRVVEGETSRSHQLRVPAGSAVGDFCDQLAKRGLFPADLDVVDLKVFANRAKDSFEKYGADTMDPIIVKVPQVWFKIMKTDGHVTGEASVPLAEYKTIHHLQNALEAKYRSTHFAGVAANSLQVFNGSVGPLGVGLQIGSLGQPMEEALIVTVACTRGREETKEVADDNPAKRQRADIDRKWVWREEETVDSVQGGRMAFVNPDHAMGQLREFHERNYNRANAGLGGQMWAVPLVDNVLGIGKTRFGAEYIRRCQQLWAADPNQVDDSFLGTLSKCHTIHIQFSPMDLLDAESEFNFVKAVAAFVRHVCRVFELKYGGLPRALSPKSLEDRTSIYLVFAYLMLEVGPLLIVIDKIGAAFDTEKLDDAGKRECLKKFCINILQPIFSIHRLFFLNDRS